MDEQNKKFEPIPKELNTLGKEVVDATFKVPKKNLGPGLLEKIYEACLCYELSKKEIISTRQVEVPINYDGLFLIKFETGCIS